MGYDTINKTISLPNKLFTVIVPTIATYSPMELEVLGITPEYNVQKRKVDKNSIYQGFSKVKLNLDRIIDLYRDGYPIRLVNPEETAEIYKILEEYLIEMNNTVRMSPNLQNVRDDRLEDIDRFCEEMFGFNKHTVVKNLTSFNNGFDLGVNLMQLGNVQTTTPKVVDNKPVGLLSGYADDEEPQEDNTPTTYIQNYQPQVDINRIRRRTLIEDDFDIDIKDEKW